MQEMSLDGTSVLAKPGPSKRGRMKRFPWRRRKSTDYQLHVNDDGVEVHLEDRAVLEDTVDEMMGVTHLHFRLSWANRDVC